MFSENYTGDTFYSKAADISFIYCLWFFTFFFFYKTVFDASIAPRIINSNLTFTLLYHITQTIHSFLTLMFIKIFTQLYFQHRYIIKNFYITLHKVINFFSSALQTSNIIPVIDSRNNGQKAIFYGFFSLYHRYSKLSVSIKTDQNFC